MILDDAWKRRLANRYAGDRYMETCRELYNKVSALQSQIRALSNEAEENRQQGNYLWASGELIWIEAVAKEYGESAKFKWISEDDMWGVQLENGDKYLDKKE